MKPAETTIWSPTNALCAGTRKVKELLNYPVTFIVLVWLFLGLAFYLASEFL